MKENGALTGENESSYLMNSQKRMIFLINSPILLGIFDSEALSFLKWVRKSGFQTDMILFVDPDWRQKKDYAEKLDAIREDLEGGRLVTIDRPSQFQGFSAFERGLINALEDLLENPQERRIIHCMGYLLTYISLKAKKKRFPNLKIHSDLRGILPEECLYYEKGWVPLRILRFILARKMEKVIVREADSLSCVSEAFKNYLLKKYQIPDDKIIVVPLCIDTEKFYFSSEKREKFRKKTGWENKFVVIYCGKHQKWQLPEQMIRNMAILAEQNQPSKAIILTRVPDDFKKDIDRLSPEMAKHFEIHCAPHHEVSNYLMAADLGVLFRKQDLVNMVACPTKFAEYISCGLSVLCTEGIGDISGMVREKNLGWVIYNPFSKKQIEEVSRKIAACGDTCFNNESRTRRSREAAEVFSWEKRIGTVTDRYHNLLNNSSF